MKMATKLVVLGVLACAGVASVAAQSKKEFRLYTWTEYIDLGLLKKFEKETGYKVKADYYSSNEEMVAKLQAGGLSQYDVVVPSDFIVPSMVGLKLLQPVDLKKIPNFKNVDKRFANPPFDPGNKYTTPWLWGTVGLMYRSDKNKSAPASWKVIFEPKANQKFMFMDSPREMMGIALRYLGFSANTKNPNEIKKAGEALLKAKQAPGFLGFIGGVEATKRVVSGQADFAVVYNGDALRTATKETGYTLPGEGSTLWADNMAIPAKAPNLEAAHQWINFYLDAKNNATNANYQKQATQNAAAKAFVDKTDLKNAAIYPSDAILKKSEFILELGNVTKLYDEVWTAVKSR